MNRPIQHQHKLIDPTLPDWTAAMQRLRQLNYEEVKRLAVRLGNHFSGDKSATKEDYISILDENYWDDFEREYQRIIDERRH